MASPTEGFIYVKALTPHMFAQLFDHLFLPRDEWSVRLGVQKLEFRRFAERCELPGFIDPTSRRQCYRGADVRAALNSISDKRAFRPPVEVPAWRLPLRVELRGFHGAMWDGCHAKH